MQSVVGIGPLLLGWAFRHSPSSCWCLIFYRWYHDVQHQHVDGMIWFLILDLIGTLPFARRC